MSSMKANLEKLRSLSEDDKTEAAMLRSRIDEQSQLIMILKRVSHAQAKVVIKIDLTSSSIVPK